MTDQQHGPNKTPLLYFHRPLRLSSCHDEVAYDCDHEKCICIAISRNHQLHSSGRQQILQHFRTNFSQFIGQICTRVHKQLQGKRLV